MIVSKELQSAFPSGCDRSARCCTGSTARGGEETACDCGKNPALQRQSSSVWTAVDTDTGLDSSGVSPSMVSCWLCVLGPDIYLSIFQSSSNFLICEMA